MKKKIKENKKKYFQSNPDDLPEPTKIPRIPNLPESTKIPWNENSYGKSIMNGIK